LCAILSSSPAASDTGFITRFQERQKRGRARPMN
jgi:hypothetical protein